MVTKLVATLLAVFFCVASATAPASVTVAKDSSSSRLSKTSGLPGEDPLSFSLWFYIIAYGTSTGYIFTMHDAGNLNIYALRIDSAGVLNLSNNVGNTTGSTLSTGTWYFIAGRRSGTTMEVYLNGSSTADISRSENETAAAESEISIGNPNSGAALTCNCVYANFKYWQAYLTPEEFANEKWSYRPHRTANIYMWAPLWSLTRINDFGGLADDLASAGAGWTSTDAAPPVGW